LRAWLGSIHYPFQFTPINGDADSRTDAYINALSTSDFHAVDTFFKKQWGRYREYDFDPVKLQLQEPVLSQPPMPPNSTNVLSIMLWSLRLRIWAYQHSIDGDKNVINIFVRYHQVD
jgi:hypothetical protein